MLGETKALILHSEQSKTLSENEREKAKMGNKTESRIQKQPLLHKRAVSLKRQAKHFLLGVFELCEIYGAVPTNFFNSASS